MDELVQIQEEKWSNQVDAELQIITAALGKEKKMKLRTMICSSKETVQRRLNSIRLKSKV